MMRREKERNEFKDPAVRITSAAPKYIKKSAAMQNKKKHVDDGRADFNNPENMVCQSAKERRKVLRDEKEKSWPTRFYDEVNTKNKNIHKKGVIDEKLAFRGHTKKIPNK